jgi:hypothetical protein
MKEIIDLLFHLKGSHTAVARALGYTGRQYRNIRKKVETGERLHPRVETFIRVKSQIIQGNSRARNILSLTSSEGTPQARAARS